MLIFDFNQICVASVMVQASAKHGVVPGPDILRHMILESLRMNIQQFKQYANPVVIAADGRSTWRKEVFKYYKFKRASDRAKIAPNVNWTEVFGLISEIVQDLKTNFPYVVIQIDRAEGDDVIGTLVKHHHTNDQFDGIMIIGGDKDYKQLHYDSRVRQYSPVQKDYVKSDGAEIERKSIIICGDRNDGVPNVLSPDNSFAANIRQTKMTANKKAELMAYQSPTDIRDQTIQRNYFRNMVLTDLTKTPKELREEIVSEFEQQRQSLPPSMKVFNYLVKKQLIELSQKAQDFIV